ncbi:MAG: hypothetical protein HRT87_04595 [Legionellales bacterium]|nr:hypothetical protein [Legionellales bacterium]
MKILSIIPIASNRLNNAFAEIFAKAVRPGTEVHTVNIRKGALGIKNRIESYESSLEVINMIKDAEAKGYDGVHVNIMFDLAGTEVAREIVRIPVLGAFSPNITTVMALARKFSIIAVAESEESIFIEHCRSYGVSESLASVRSLNIIPQDINSESNPKIINQICQLSLKIIQEDKAQAIVLGCTALFDCAKPVADFLEKTLNKRIPVIDPNAISISYLEMLIRNNLSHSQATYSI